MEQSRTFGRRRPPVAAVSAVRARPAPRANGLPKAAGRVEFAAARGAGRTARGRRHENRVRQQQPAARRGGRGILRPAAGRRRHPALLRPGGVRRNPRERARRGHVPRPVHILPRQRQFDGVARHHRRAAPRVGAADNRRGALFRLRPAGPQTRPQNADLRQIGGQPDHHRRRRPDADHGPACRADTGVLRHPGRQPVRRADDGRRHRPRARRRRLGGGVARRGRGDPRPRHRAAD